MVMVENGCSYQDAKYRWMLMKLHQFYAPAQSRPNICTQKRYDQYHHQNQRRSKNGNEEGEEVSLKREMRWLEEMFSKLNPMARESVPPPHVNTNGGYAAKKSSADADVSYFDGFGNKNGNRGQRKKKINGYDQAMKRINSRTNRAQRHGIIRRTVYVSDIDRHITEEQLAALFLRCGQVVDCRVCGDPNSVLRFAFVEFTDEEAARFALSLSGTMLGYYPVKVLPSKTAIAPVNPTFLPQTLDEREMCERTVYVTNIDRKVSQADVKLFFETICGQAESAVAALNCTGVILGSLPIRVSPSKTPVRSQAPRPATHSP